MLCNHCIDSCLTVIEVESIVEVLLGDHLNDSQCVLYMFSSSSTMRFSQFIDFSAYETGQGTPALSSMMV